MKCMCMYNEVQENKQNNIKEIKRRVCTSLKLSALVCLVGQSNLLLASTLTMQIVCVMLILLQ